MSEVTTGAVPLALIGAPLAAGAACIGAIYFAAKYCEKQYEKMLHEIEEADEKLKWLDNQQITSPVQMAEEAKRLQKMVSMNNVFSQMTQSMNTAQKEILAGAIATQNSPLKAYVSRLMDELPETQSSFDQALKQGTKNLAVDNFSFVNKIVKDAAVATGFVGVVKMLKQTNTVTDIVFSEIKNPAKKFTAYCKLDRNLNPSLALDLEGYGCETNECTNKMNEIVTYLQNHGVPFHFTRIKHNQPMGVLRKMLILKEEESKKDEIVKYLTGTKNSSKDYLKNK